MFLKRFLVTLFLLVIAYHLSATPQVSNKLDKLVRTSDQLIKNGKPGSAYLAATELLKLSQNAKNDYYIAEAYFYLALSMQKKGKLSAASDYIVKAINIAEKGNDRRLGGYYYFLSGIFFELREGEKSLFYTRKAGEVFKKYSDDFFERNKIDTIIHEILSGEIELALVHLDAAESKVDPVKEPYIASKLHLFQSHANFAKKQYQQSLYYLNKTLPYLKAAEKQYPGIRLHVEAAFAQTLVALKDFKQAQYYFDRNIDRAIKEMDLNDVRDCFKIGAEIYQGLGKYEKSLGFLNKFVIYNDSINSLSLKKSIYDTEVKYRTALKEKAISEQKLQLVNKDYELQKKNRYLILGFSAIVLLILSILIIYLVYRNKNQSVELSLLKAQIHPHFLFNTLNNLYALSIGKSDKAPGVVLGLANILRYILYECNILHASLQKEMEVIEEYISLEKIRYADDLEVNTTYIRASLEGYTIAPLLLLPLVENAYKHGASKLEKDSWINIEAKISGGRFLFKISNNKPLNKNPNSPKTKYGNIGLKNIKKRLDILYPRKHQFKAMDSEDVFLVSLEIEVKRKVFKD